MYKWKREREYKEEKRKEVRIEKGMWKVGKREERNKKRKEGEKVKMHKKEKEKKVELPGGGVELGEKSTETIIREIQEEMGLEVRNIKSLGSLENFFVHKDKKFHGIEFIYTAEFAKQSPYDQSYIEGIEDRGEKGRLMFKWIDINDLEEMNFKPESLINVIRKGTFESSHIINSEM